MSSATLLRPSRAALCAAALFCGPRASAQIQVLLQAGDVLATGVAVEDSTLSSPFHLLQVNDSGEWLVRARLESSTDEAVVRSGSLALRTGDPAPAGGGTIVRFHSFDLTDAGRVLWALELAGGVGDEAVFLDGTLVAASGTTPLDGGWSPFATYVDFRELSLSEDATRVVVRGTVDDPSIIGTVEDFKALWTLDATGALVAEEVLARETETPVGYTAGNLLFFGIGADKTTINAAGHTLFSATVLGTGPGEGTTAIWLNTTGTAAGSSLIARAGEPVPGTAFTWGSLAGPEVTINDAGSWVVNTHLAGVLSGGPNVLFGDGAVLRTNGDTHPEFPGRTLDHFGDGPVKLADDGALFWYGNFTGDGSADAAWFKDDGVVAKEGTAVAGGVLEDIRGLEGDMDASGNGRFVIFEAKLDGVPTVFLWDSQALFTTSCNGDAGDQLGCTDCPCGNNAVVGTIGGCLNSSGGGARLLAEGVPSVANDTLRFELTGAPAGAFTVLVSGDSVAPTNPANPCFGLATGVLAASFDGLRCAVGATQRHGGRPADANGDVGATNNGWGPPSGPPVGLVAQGGFALGATRHFQVVLRELPTLVCMRGLNTSQSIGLTVQP